MPARRAWRVLEQTSPVLFICSGVLLLVQVMLIGLRRYEMASFPESWIAVPSIPGVIAGIVALIGLYAQLSNESPTLARFAAGAAATAGLLLCTAAVWLIIRGMSGGLPQPLPVWFFGLAAAFIVAFILAFILGSVASLKAGWHLKASLLFVPVVAWGIILVAGVITNMSDALRLDFYTNAAIACAFIALGLGATERGSSTMA